MPKRLAEFIDQIGGGCPLVTLIEAEGKQAVLWQYEKLDIVIRCGGRQNEENEQVRFDSEAPIDLASTSIVAAFELIRQTETIRQPNVVCPYLRFGPICGTSSDLEFLVHPI